MPLVEQTDCLAPNSINCFDSTIETKRTNLPQKWHTSPFKVTKKIKHNLRECLLKLDEHAGVSKGGDDDVNDGEDGSKSGCDEGRERSGEGEESPSPGLTQNALLRVPLLLLSACWSHRKTSSLLSLAMRSLVRSLSTQRITHSRLLSTLSQTFSWSRRKSSWSTLWNFALKHCKIKQQARPYPFLLLPVHIHRGSVAPPAPFGLRRALVISQHHTLGVVGRGGASGGDELWTCGVQRLDSCGQQLTVTHRHQLPSLRERKELERWERWYITVQCFSANNLTLSVRMARVLSRALVERSLAARDRRSV